MKRALLLALAGCSAFGSSSSGASSTPPNDGGAPGVDAAVPDDGPKGQILGHVQNPSYVRLDDDTVFVALHANSDKTGGGIARVKKDGSSVGSVTTDVGDVTAIVRDDVNVYFASAPIPGVDGTGGLQEVAKANQGTRPFQLNASAVTDVALDATSFYVCGTTGKVELLGRQAPEVSPLTIATVNNCAALAVEGNDLFYGGDHLYRNNLGDVTAPPVQLTQGPVRRFVLDDTFVYSIASETADVLRTRRDGTKPSETVATASGPTNAGDIAIFGDYVYWARNAPGGEILRALKSAPGAAPIVVAKNLDSPAGVAVDTSGIYWSETGSGTLKHLLPTD